MRLIVKELKKWLGTQPDDAEIFVDVYKHNKTRETIIAREYVNGKVNDSDITVFLSNDENEDNV